ncbi:sporulation protein YjcZ [Paenibacillus swuensis]|nr:sporulation protein YjcZ [Paenibacillus swuensis]
MSNYGANCGAGVGGAYSSVGAILVLYILLVIILSAYCF